MSAARSHFRFSRYVRDSSGVVLGVKNLSKVFSREYADLVNTAWHNPSTGEDVVYALGFDLDAKRCNPRWFDAEGKIDISRVLKTLETDHFPIFKYLIAAARSAGGKGIHLFFGISPLVLRESTARAQKAAKSLQIAIFKILTSYEMGADASALGLKREFANWLKTSSQLYYNKIIKKILHDKKNAPNAIAEMLAYTNTVVYPTKRKLFEEGAVLYPDARAENKLAVLYQDIFDAMVFEDGSLTITKTGLHKKYGLSQPFIRKQLIGLSWLKVTETVDGLRLRVDLDERLARRANSLFNGQKDQPRGYQRPSEDKPSDKLFCVGDAKPAIEVMPGERNASITRVALHLKWAGVDLERALDVVNKYASEISGSTRSKSCKGSQKTVKNIYNNKPHLFAIAPSCLPLWLSQAVADSIEASEINYKKLPPYRGEVAGSPAVHCSSKRVLEGGFVASVVVGGTRLPVFYSRFGQRDFCCVLSGRTTRDLIRGFDLARFELACDPQVISTFDVRAGIENHLIADYGQFLGAKICFTKNDRGLKKSAKMAVKSAGTVFETLIQANAALRTGTACTELGSTTNALIKGPYAVERVGSVKVGWDGFFALGKGLYSVPFPLRGKKVQIKVGAGKVEVLEEGDKVAEHVFDPLLKGRFFDPNHLVSADVQRNDFFVRRMLREARQKGLCLDACFAIENPLFGLRRAQKLVRDKRVAGK